MLLCPSLPVSTTPICDFILSCNGVDYNINKSLFSEYSSFFRNITKMLTTDIVHTNVRFSNHVFSSFVDACQNRPFVINYEEINSFKKLCNEWGANDIKEYVEKIVSQINESSNITNSSLYKQLNEKIDHLAHIIEAQQKEIDSLKNALLENDRYKSLIEKQISDLKIKSFSSENAFSIGLNNSESNDEINHGLQSPTFTSNKAKTINFSGKPLKGLFFWLKQQTKERLRDSGFVNVHVSSTSRVFSTPPFAIIEQDPCCRWFSENEENQWMKIDFIDRVVEISGYTIKESVTHLCYWFLRSWKLEGSTDDINWYIIDEHRMNEALNENVPMCTWTCNMKGPFRYIRITQTGLNANGDNYFMLGAVELFGRIHQRPPFFG